MEGLISRAISIATTTLVFSLLLGIISLYGGISYNMKSNKEWYDGMRIDMQLENVIYPFDKDNSSTDLIGGTDIVDFILKYNKIYTYVIKENDGDTGFEFSATHERELNSEGKDGKEIWSQKYLTDFIIGNTPDVKYKSNVTGIENGAANVVFTFTKGV